MRLAFDRPNDIAQIHDALLAAGIAVVRVEGDPESNQFWVIADDGADEAAIAAVVVAHDPTPRVVVNPDAELAIAITAATTLEQLKSALLGKTRAGKIKAQPRA